MTITKRGRELADHLAPFIGGSDAIIDICSRIGRLAQTHRRLQECDCNGELTDGGRKSEARIEARIRELVAMLPDAGRGRITVKFSGDPRWYTVKLVVPGDRGGNTWGRDGRYGV